MIELDWQLTLAPHHVEMARMYQVATVDKTDDKDAEDYLFDPVLGVFFMLTGRTWMVSIQTFQPREVHNK